LLPTQKEGDCAIADLNFTVVNNGVKVDYPESGCTKSTLKIPDVEGTFEAVQFHIHLSSEHTIDGNYFGAELHIVHKQKDGDRYAVVGMMIQPDAPENHPMFGALIDGWEAFQSAELKSCNLTTTDTATSRISDNTEFTAYGLLVDNSTFYFYDGSLTTPPCSEVVWWNLNDTPVLISVKQFEQLVLLTLNYLDHDICTHQTLANPSGSTSRPVVPLYGRTVSRICPVGFQDESAPVVVGAATSAAAPTTAVASLAAACAVGVVWVGLGAVST
jgi:carbonic anhydrase